MADQPTKIEKELTDAQFRELCDKLLALPGSDRTLRGIQDLVAATYGVDVSLMGAKSFRDGPYARYAEKRARGQAAREQLVAAARGGVQTIDAIEEAMVLELEDHLSTGELDMKFVVGTLLKLRTSISLREDSRRKQGKLEADLKLRDEQIAKLVADRDEREEKKRKLQETITAAKKKNGLTRETLEQIEMEAKLL